MGWLYHLNTVVTEVLEGFLVTAVPMIAGLAEVIGLFIIITSLAKATYHYIRTIFFNDHHDFHHEMSSGLTTALEFLLAATFALRAMMSLMLHWEMQGGHRSGHKKAENDTEAEKND